MPGIARARDGAHLRVGDDPGQGQLGQGGAVRFGQRPQLVQRLLDARIMLGLAEPVAGAVVALGEAVVRSEFAGEQPLGHGRISQHTQALLAAIGQALFFGHAPEKRVGRLQALDRGILPGLFELGAVEVGDADGADLSLRLRIVERAQRLFQGHGFLAERTRRPVDLVQIDIVRPQIFQAVVAGGDHLVVAQMIGEHLAGQDRLVSRPGQSLSDHAFGVAVAVGFGRVERGDAGRQGRVHGRAGLAVVDILPHGLAGLPGAHDNGRHPDVRVSQASELHPVLLVAAVEISPRVNVSADCTIYPPCGKVFLGP